MLVSFWLELLSKLLVAEEVEADGRIAVPDKDGRRLTAGDSFLSSRDVRILSRFEVLPTACPMPTTCGLSGLLEFEVTRLVLREC